MVINVVAAKGRGVLNGYMQAGMLLARSLFGGGALVLAAQWGLPAIIAIMILAILSTTLLLPFIKEPVDINSEKKQLKDFKKNLLSSFQSRGTWYAIGFALTAAAAFEAAGAMAGPFMTDKRISIETIGFFFGIPVVVALLIGGLIGGFLSDKLSRKTSVAVFLGGFVLMVALISIVGIIYPAVSQSVWITLFTGMYFFTGMFVSSSYALFMDVTNPKLGATQFSTFMAATNGCESWVVWVAGIIAASHGYSYAFLVMSLVSLLGLVMLRKIKI
jgi:MFS family permease